MALKQSRSQAQLYGFISQGPRSEALEEINSVMEKNQLLLRKIKRKAFYTAVACEDFRAGAESLLQVCVDGIQKRIFNFRYVWIFLSHTRMCSVGSENYQKMRLS